jgi:hypothetical protein
MLRVYVAGPYAAKDELATLRHIRDGINVSARLLELGLAPYCPWFDYHFILAGETDLPVEAFYGLSNAWLDASEAMLVTGDWSNSKGTKAEIVRAQERGIPVFHDIPSLLHWKADMEGSL